MRASVLKSILLFPAIALTTSTGTSGSSSSIGGASEQLAGDTMSPAMKALVEKALKQQNQENVAAKEESANEETGHVKQPEQESPAESAGKVEGAEKSSPTN